MRVRWTIGIIGVVGLAVTGCMSTPTPGSPGAASSTTSTTASVPAGVPAVAHPLDVSKVRQAPCSVLTSAQLTQLNVAGSGKVVSSGSPTCDWGDSAQQSKIGVTVIFPPADNGLADIYSQKDTYAVFKPVPDVDGFPAVIALSADSEGQGICQVSVGVSNQQIIDIGVTMGAQAPDATKACTPNQTVAAAVISTIKG